MLDLSSALHDFITLWVVVDPIGTLPVFIAVTAGLTAGERRIVAFRSIIVAFFILLAFIVLGQVLLEALDLGLPSFQIAGAIVLFLFALQMIFGPSKPESEVETATNYKESAVFPLAIPSIAGPGAMLTVVLLTDNNRFSIGEQILTAGVMAAILAVVLFFMLLATPILKLIGTSGASIISRVMGMILAAVAVNSLLGALVDIGVMPAF